MAQPLVSVVIPIYKVEKYLRECLDSILSQTYTNLEIILVDDGSPDSCGLICDQYASRDSRIRVLHKHNEGLGKARNSGLSMCTGELLMLVDSDDYISEDAVEILYNRMLADNSDMAVGQSVYYDPKNGTESLWSRFNEDSILSREDAFAQLGMKGNIPCSVWGKLYRRCVYENIIFPNLSCGEDLWVFPHVLEKCERISVSTQKVYYYLRRASSTMNTLDEEKRQCSVEAALHVANYLFKRGNSINAGYFFRSALNVAMNVQDKRKMLAYFQKSIPVKESMKYLDRNFKNYMKWCCLHHPCLFPVFKELSKMKFW